MLLLTPLPSTPLPTVVKTDHDHLGIHESNGLIAVCILVGLIFISQLLEVVNGGFYDTFLVPQSAVPVDLKGDAEPAFIVDKHIQADVSLIAARSFTNLSVVSVPGCGVGEPNAGNVAMLQLRKAETTTHDFFVHSPWKGSSPSSVALADSAACDAQLKDEQGYDGKDSAEEFRARNKARVVRKNTCTWHTVQLCAAADGHMSPAKLITSFRQDYEDRNSWRGAAVHVDTDSPDPVTLRVCPTLTKRDVERHVDVGWLLAEHGTAYSTHASGDAAGTCFDVVIGAGETWAATLMKQESLKETIPGTGTLATQVRLSSLKYVGAATNLLHGYHRDPAAWANRETRTQSPQSPQFKNSRTLFLLRTEEDVRVYTKSKVFAVLGGLGGLFTLVVGVVGWFVFAAGFARASVQHVISLYDFLATSNGLSYMPYIFLSVL